MEKEKLKRPYQGAQAEIVYIHSSDIIQTSGDNGQTGANGWDGSNVTGNGWT